MAIVIGRNCKAYYSALSPESYNEIANVITATLDFSADTIEADHRDISGGWSSISAGSRSGTASIEVMRDWDAASHDALATACSAGTKLLFKILDAAAPTGAGYKFTAGVTGFSTDEPLDGYATATFSLTLDGIPVVQP